MATHPGLLVAYDAAGNIVHSLAHLVQYADDGTPLGLVDFAAHEEQGGDHTDIWAVDSGDPSSPIKGSKVWPEWLGPAVLDFRVELTGPPGQKRIGALVHKTSGARRERSALEAEINRRVLGAGGLPADIRDLVGGPDRPLSLDNQGRTADRPVRAATRLPLLRADLATKSK